MRACHAQAGSIGVGGDAAAVVPQPVQVRAWQVDEVRARRRPSGRQRRPVARRPGILTGDEHAAAGLREMTQADGAQFRRRLRLRDQPAVRARRAGPATDRSRRSRPDRSRHWQRPAYRREGAIRADRRRASAMPRRDGSGHARRRRRSGRSRHRPAFRLRKEPIAAAECRMAAEHEARRRLHRLPYEAPSGVEYQQEPARPAGDGNGQPPSDETAKPWPRPGNSTS